MRVIASAYSVVLCPDSLFTRRSGEIIASPQLSSGNLRMPCRYRSFIRPFAVTRNKWKQPASSSAHLFAQLGAEPFAGLVVAAVVRHRKSFVDGLSTSALTEPAEAAQEHRSIIIGARGDRASNIYRFLTWFHQSPVRVLVHESRDGKTRAKNSLPMEYLHP